VLKRKHIVTWHKFSQRVGLKPSGNEDLMALFASRWCEIGNKVSTDTSEQRAISWNGTSLHWF